MVIKSKVQQRSIHIEEYAVDVVQSIMITRDAGANGRAPDFSLLAESPLWRFRYLALSCAARCAGVICRLRAGPSDPKAMSPVPQIQKVQPLMQSRLFAIEAVDLLFENGQACTFERLVGQGEGAVMVVPVLSPERLLVVREYAVGVERYELELCEGRIDAGESPEEAADGNCAKRLVLMRGGWTY